jgi:hypothetical protein
VVACTCHPSYSEKPKNRRNAVQADLCRKRNSKVNRAKRAGDMAEVIELLAGNHILTSPPLPSLKKKNPIIIK